MAGANIKAIRSAFKDFQKEIEAECLREISVYAQNIVYKAIQYRLNDQAAHNFTGNLLNSIVVCLYLPRRSYDDSVLGIIISVHPNYSQTFACF